MGSGDPTPADRRPRGPPAGTRTPCRDAGDAAVRVAVVGAATGAVLLRPPLVIAGVEAAGAAAPPPPPQAGLAVAPETRRGVVVVLPRRGASAATARADQSPPRVAAAGRGVRGATPGGPLGGAGLPARSVGDAPAGGRLPGACWLPDAALGGTLGETLDVLPTEATDPRHLTREALRSRAPIHVMDAGPLVRSRAPPVPRAAESGDRLVGVPPPTAPLPQEA